ncbi:MAG: hypothetical protein COA78_02530 [Blastopirellula sp.]|nr:MAG: hypothetical protein COA78_02530 [Blastopirellula sp.]
MSSLSLRTMIRVTLLLLLPISASLFLLVPEASAQNFWEEDYEPNTLDDPIGSGEESLQQLPQAPWYNAESGQVQPVAVSVTAEDAKASEPTTRPRKDPPPKPKNTGTWNWPSWLNWDLSFLGFGFYTILYIVFAALLIGLVIIVMRTIAMSSEEGIMSNNSFADEITSHVDRVENLPFQLKRPDSDFLTEARRHYNEGNYREAIVYLFSYELVELDKGQVIHLTKGKTNGQYLREMGRRLALRGILELTMNAFEDVFFGQRELSKRQFESCWDQVDQFKTLVQGGAS